METNTTTENRRPLATQGNAGEAGLIPMDENPQPTAGTSCMIGEGIDCNTRSLRKRLMPLQAGSMESQSTFLDKNPQPQESASGMTGNRMGTYAPSQSPIPQTPLDNTSNALYASGEQNPHPPAGMKQGHPESQIGCPHHLRNERPSNACLEGKHVKQRRYSAPFTNIVKKNKVKICHRQVQKANVPLRNRSTSQNPNPQGPPQVPLAMGPTNSSPTQAPPNIQFPSITSLPNCTSTQGPSNIEFSSTEVTNNFPLTYGPPKVPSSMGIANGLLIKIPSNITFPSAEGSTKFVSPQGPPRVFSYIGPINLLLIPSHPNTIVPPTTNTLNCTLANAPLNIQLPFNQASPNSLPTQGSWNFPPISLQGNRPGHPVMRSQNWIPLQGNLTANMSQSQYSHATPHYLDMAQPTHCSSYTPQTHGHMKNNLRNNTFVETSHLPRVVQGQSPQCHHYHCENIVNPSYPVLPGLIPQKVLVLPTIYRSDNPIAANNNLAPNHSQIFAINDDNNIFENSNTTQLVPNLSNHPTNIQQSVGTYQSFPSAEPHQARYEHRVDNSHPPQPERFFQDIAIKEVNEIGEPLSNHSHLWPQQKSQYHSVSGDPTSLMDGVNDQPLDLSLYAENDYNKSSSNCLANVHVNPHHEHYGTTRDCTSTVMGSSNVMQKEKGDRCNIEVSIHSKPAENKFYEHISTANEQMGEKQNDEYLNSGMVMSLEVPDHCVLKRKDDEDDASENPKS